MALSIQSYKGARDFYPEDKRVLNAIFEKWRNVCLRFGYEEYDAPILEPVELYAAKSGEELVNDQSYRFVDRGGREIMLRPEMTPSVSRLVAGKRQELTMPLRWFSIPSCWRYERPQKGRGREFYQLNVDLFGISTYEAEVEMLQMVDALMTSFSAKQDTYQLKINSRVLMDHILGTWLGLDAVEQKTISKLIDRMHKVPHPEFIALIEASIAPSLREQGAADKLLQLLNTKSLEELPEDLQKHDSVKNLKHLKSISEASGITNVVYDITLIRGLDYYTDFVFEVFDTDPQNNRSLFGGGRYDGLVGLFGVESIPTIGFALSDVTLMEFLKGHNLVPKTKVESEIYIIPIGDVYDGALSISQKLRGMGVNTVLDITNRKIDKQLKSALKKEVPYVLFIGEKELENEQFTLKKLTTGIEETHSLHRIVSIVKDHRKA
ncbi:histidine--tRNA ligase [Candidatus Saccharibacteria bacterium]|nr:histidine--tRNA ligase [Candidatus Saccharibacteria bacterium]